MARQVTDKVVGAFIRQEKASSGNTRTDGKALYLHGNKIAEHRDGYIWITTAGWDTVTTLDRLRYIVPVYKHKGDVHLFGQPWNGEWTNTGKFSG